MNNPKRKHRTCVKPLASGQVWHMAESDLHVKGVGRRLVQYKLFRGDAKKTVTTMSAVSAVESYLIDKKAVLVQE